MTEVELIEYSELTTMDPGDPIMEVPTDNDKDNKNNNDKVNIC